MRLRATKRFCLRAHLSVEMSKPFLPRKMKILCQLATLSVWGIQYETRTSTMRRLCTKRTTNLRTTSTLLRPSSRLRAVKLQAEKETCPKSNLLLPRTWWWFSLNKRKVSSHKSRWIRLHPFKRHPQGRLVYGAQMRT